MPLKVITNELPRSVRRSVAETIEAETIDARGEWTASMKPAPNNNAWDVEVTGPDRFHWSRRFSGKDRDGEVIAEAIRSAVDPSGPALNNALSALAIQGIAFMEDTGSGAPGDRTYMVDRVRLKESEIVYLHSQGALTAAGIRRYLLDRPAA